MQILFKMDFSVQNVKLTQLMFYLSSFQTPTKEQSLRDISRRKEESNIYPSLRTTRCEEWSTLRETLPSRGSARRIEHPRWGTGLGPAPVCSIETPRRNPMITSAMSR